MNSTFLQENSPFSLQMLTLKHKAEAVEFLSHSVALTELTFKGLGYTPEEVRHFAEIEVAQSIKHNLCVSMWAGNTLVGLICAQDMADYVDADEVACEMSTSFKEKHGPWEETVEKFQSAEIKKYFDADNLEPYQSIAIDMVCVHPEYRRHGLFVKMMKYIMFEHFLTRNTKFIIGLSTSTASFKGFEGLGAYSIGDIPYKDLIYRGRHVFCNMDSVRKMYPKFMEDKLRYFVIPREELLKIPSPKL